MGAESAPVKRSSRPVERSQRASAPAPPEAGVLTQLPLSRGKLPEAACSLRRRSGVLRPLRRSVLEFHREALTGAVDPVTAWSSESLLLPRREGSVEFPQTLHLRWSPQMYWCSFE